MGSGIEQELVRKHVELAYWRRREETRLLQLAKIKWGVEGDQNSKFFHAHLAYKRNKIVMEMRLQDGTYLRSPEEIHLGVVNYFSDFLQKEVHENSPDLGHLISPVITV